MNRAANAPTLIGHPYAPLGRGEDIRCTFRSLRSVAAEPLLRDIYGLVPPSDEAMREFGHRTVTDLGALNIFHINGDEVEQALTHLRHRRDDHHYDIVYPQWELSKYPSDWAHQLDRFDEIWAPSKFVQECLAAACKKPVIYMPLATEVVFTGFLGRRYFAIPESHYVFLFFFDFRSYLSRKNPSGAVEAFRKLIGARSSSPLYLVVKVSGAEHDPRAYETFRAEISDLQDRMLLIDRSMSDNEIKNLVRCCDCFLSLHRSEGYGRGLAEAMYLGKPVIATAYSGNMDFMSSESAFFVSYRLVPLTDGAYPYWQNQVWAEPDVDQASTYMARLVDNPSVGDEMGRSASRRIRAGFGYRPSGLRYLTRLEEVAVCMS